MQSNLKYFLFFVAVIFLSACEKEDQAVPASGLVVNQIDLGNSYTYQAFFDLSSGTQKARHSKYEWDLGFSSEGNAIFLNASRLMKVFRTQKTNFDSIYSFSFDDHWRWDNPTGSPMETAIGEWMNSDGSSKKMVYLIDLGINEVGDTLGFRKLQIQSSSSTTFTIRYAYLNGAKEQYFVVERDESVLQTYFSLMSNQQFYLQPNKAEWDLHFTSYTDGLWDGVDTIPYIVTGVLQNSYGSISAFDDSLEYEEIRIEDVSTFDFSSDANNIGYNWKYFNFDKQVYAIVEGVNYVIRDLDGIYYKLRFVGFYNNSGEKGSPQFEYEKL